MSSRSFIDKINDCCAIGYIGNISIVSNLDCHIACSIFRNNNNNSSITFINYPDVILSGIDPRYFKCCMIIISQVFTVTIIIDIDGVGSNSQILNNQNTSAVGHRNSVSSNTYNLNGHVTSSINRNRYCNDFNITQSNVFTFN